MILVNIFINDKSSRIFMRVLEQFLLIEFEKNIILVHVQINFYTALHTFLKIIKEVEDLCSFWTSFYGSMSLLNLVPPHSLTLTFLFS